MTSWRNALILTKWHFRHHWLGIIGTLLFYSYLGLISMAMMNEFITTRKMSVMTDFIFLVSFSNCGYMFQRGSKLSWNMEGYTRRLTSLRLLPIRLQDIVASRVLHMIMSSFLAITIFFVWQYLISWEVRQLLNPLQLIEFGVVWFGFALVITSLYLYIELSKSGKALFIFSTILVFVYLLGSIGIYYQSGGKYSLVSWIIDMIHSAGPVLPLVSLLIGAVIITVSMKLGTNNLKTRDLP